MAGFALTGNTPHFSPPKQYLNSANIITAPLYVETDTVVKLIFGLLEG
jgi:hypothetical protein